MRLGDALQITISVKDLNESLEFYKSMGFRIANRSDENLDTPWARVTDGRIVIFLTQTSGSFLGLTYFCTDTNERVAHFQKKGIQFAHVEHSADDPNSIEQAIIWDANNIALAIIRLDPQTVYMPSGNSFALCGQFAEISLQTTQMDADLKLWLNLGFNVVTEEKSPIRSVVISDGIIIIGIHETQSLNQPSFIYSSENMREHALGLADLGLPVFQVDNSSEGAPFQGGVVAPEGTLFFFLEY